MSAALLHLTALEGPSSASGLDADTRILGGGLTPATLGCLRKTGPRAPWNNAGSELIRPKHQVLARRLPSGWPQSWKLPAVLTPTCSPGLTVLGPPNTSCIYRCGDGRPWAMATTSALPLNCDISAGQITRTASPVKVADPATWPKGR